MSDAGFKLHVFLNRDFARSGAFTPGEGAMPAPNAPLILPANAPHNVPSVELLEGALSHYPLKLNDILMREKLRAHFDFRCTDFPHAIPTCFDREQLDVRTKELIAYADEPVAGWNLMQIRVAKMLIDNAPKAGRAVSLDTIHAFQKSPQQFYAAMVSGPTANLQ